MAGDIYQWLAPPLTDCAARAGAAILRHFRSDVAVERKGDDSPVTAADHDAEALILAALADCAPGVPVLSEEAAAEGLGPDDLGHSFFLVDPLDGTREFLSGREDFTVNIALVEGGRPRFGLLYAPARSRAYLTLAEGQAVELWLEASEGGATLNDCASMPCLARKPGPEGLVAVASRSHLDSETERFLSTLRLAGVTQAGSALKFGLLATGAADVYPRFGPTMEWDTAAGHAVLVAAGGCVLDARGGPLAYGKKESGYRNPGFIAWGQQV